MTFVERIALWSVVGAVVGYALAKWVNHRERSRREREADWPPDEYE